VTAVLATQIEIDDSGVAWLGGTQVKVIEIVLDKVANGWSPEEIHFQHPHLSLAQIYAALAYYYENQSGLDQQLQDRSAQAEQLAASVSDPEFRKNLLASKSRLS